MEPQFNQTSPSPIRNNPVNQPINNNPAPYLNNTLTSYSLNNNSHKKIGPIIAILVIVFVLVIAALYLFASRINNEATTPIENNLMTGNIVTPAANPTVLPITNTADDLDSLQNDLNNSTTGIDAQTF